MSSTESRHNVKSRRTTRACDYCHQRAKRCLHPPNTTRCSNCAQFDQPCTYDRQAKKRGVKPKSNGPSLVSAPATTSVSATDSHETLQQKWSAPFVARQAVIVSLAEVYFEIVYPIFPFFHQPTYLRKLSRGDHNTDRRLFSATMALCALASARVRDQALFNSDSYDVDELTEVSSETFYEAAIQASIDQDFRTPQNFNSLRTCALLSLTAVQYGKVREMQAFLGRYHIYVATDGLQDEANWPPDAGIVEKEERRRLFWSMYTFEIYVSIVWNGMMRVREQQVNVSYPTELDDELFNDRGYNQRFQSIVDMQSSPASRQGQIRSDSWLCGWNFTTDLYRVLEHVITNFRDRKRHRGSFPTDLFTDMSVAPLSTVRDSVMRLYVNLPQCFKEVVEITCDPASDRYGFQVANITATVQLLRMMLFASGGGSIEERCKIASDVIDAFTQTPVTYLRAISTPLLHHLAGIGSILGSVFEESMSETAYEQVRVVLLALAQLLENLEYSLRPTTSAQRLRDLVARIDSYMNGQRNNFANIPAQLTNKIFEDWHWNLDFMQPPDTWTSTNAATDL